MSRFKVGQEVVYVDGSGHVNKDVPELILNNVYEVTGLDVINGKPHVDIKGHERGFLGQLVGYDEIHFEPVKYDYCTKELAETMVKHLGGVKKEEIERLKI